jgi:spermidine synthase
MYHVISTGFTAIILYLISYFFYRIGFYSIQVHRKIWNTLLAASFLLTAVAGIFLALQANYKWNFTFIKTVLRWHVEFGTGMAITGIFHLMWHLDYYGKFFRKSIILEDKADLEIIKPGKIKLNLFITGFVSSSVQFLLLREIMNITGGYELISGSFLGSWLIGSSIGASLAGRSRLNDIRRINLFFSLSPLVSLLLMLFLSRVFLNPGETPSFLAAMIYTFIVLIPFCMVSGFTFIKLITIAGSGNGFIPGKSFSIETIGGITAGLAVALLTAGILNTYKILLLVILISIGFVVLMFYIKGQKLRIMALIFFLLAVLILSVNTDLIFRKILLPGVAVTATKDTPYGNITKGNYKGEEDLYYNQKLIVYTDDVPEREEDIHYAMLQSDSPQKVILISGSLKSHLHEILKYPVKSIIYIERDPYLAAFAPAIPNGFEGLKIINKDAFRYIRNTTETADVIILLTPPPSTLLLNRYYTSEFFAEVKKRLGPEGIFMCTPGPGDNYFNKESVNLYSSIYNSLSANFKYVTPIVGNKLYFIASEKPVLTSICGLVNTKQIKNTYVCSDYLEDDLIKRKSDEVAALIDHSVSQNRSAYPVAYLHSQSFQ